MSSELHKKAISRIKPEERKLMLKLMQCPFVYEWCLYKGKPYFSVLNYGKSLKKGVAILDLHYCATAAMNGSLLEKTVRYKPAYFKPYDRRA